MSVAIVLASAGVAVAWPDIGSTDLDSYSLSAGDLEAISQGYPDGTWKPYTEMTRGHFAKMAVEAWGIALANPDAPSFVDVPKDHRFYQYVEALSAAGVVGGVGGGRFDPDATISREQAAAIIARHVASVFGFDLATHNTPSEINATLGAFADEGQVSSSLREELAFAVEQGIVRGSGGALAPQGLLMRIQGAAMLVRSGQGFMADLVIRNAKVLTVDDEFSVREAVAVEDGVIVFVGSNNDAEEWIGPGTEVLDLAGKVIMPGVNDSHAHIVPWALTLPPLQLDLTSAGGTTTLAQVQAKVAARAAEVAADEWIEGKGYDPWLFPDVTRYDLDAVAPNNPVALVDMSGHNMWVNSKALELAGITKDTPDPAGGVIVRDENGEPTGQLRELTAMGLVRAVTPPPSQRQRVEALTSAMTLLNQQGITSITEGALAEAGTGRYSNMQAFKTAYAEGKFTVRVTALLVFGNYGGFTFDEMKSGVDAYPWEEEIGDPRWFRIPGVKIFADGIPVSYTAWLWEPYVGDHGSGMLTIPGASEQDKLDQLTAMIRYVRSKDLQLGIHAAGDRAISSCLDAFELATADYPAFTDTRDYLIHGELITPADALRAAALGIGVNMQPVIQGMIADIEPGFIGAERAAYEWPFNTVFSAGIPMTASSDTPVTAPNWRKGMQAMITREGYMSGKVSGPDQIVTREQAVRAYTINGAIQDHQETIKGSIERGKLADFCILEKDIMTIDPHELTGTGVLMTIVGGRIVYDNSAGAFVQ